MCKLEHYDNCDPETKDQEYCIFHKPNKNEEEAKEFWRKFVERFKPEVKIDNIRKVKRFIFKKKIDCVGYVFPKIPEDFDFSFSYAIFYEFPDFTGATFEDDVDFTHANFKDGAEFFAVTFKGFANFSDTIFEDKTTFDESKFMNGAVFSNSKFLTFEINFEGAKFYKNIDFSGSKFQGIARFINTKFLVSNVIIYFTKAEFGEGIFIGSEFYDFVDFYGCRFYSTLDFSFTEFKKGLRIDDPSIQFKHPQAEAEACRVQRLFYEREGKRDNADRMFVRERRALRRKGVRQAKDNLNKSKGVKQKLRAVWDVIQAYGSSFAELILADFICKYGTNWKRPMVIWLSVVVFIFPFLYLVTGSVPNADDFLSCLYFSVVTATTLGYGDLHPIGFGRTFAPLKPSSELSCGLFSLLSLQGSICGNWFYREKVSGDSFPTNIGLHKKLRRIGIKA